MERFRGVLNAFRSRRLWQARPLPVPVGCPPKGDTPKRLVRLLAQGVAAAMAHGNRTDPRASGWLVPAAAPMCLLEDFTS